MNIYNYNHFFYFYVAAKLGGVTAAAKHLRTSQSSLSVQIKNLEETLGRPLFKKVGRKIALTDFGKEVFTFCRRAFLTFDELFDQIEKKKSSMGIRISVGVASEIERPFTTELLHKVAKSYAPGQRPLLSLVSFPTPQLLQMLKTRELDYLLVTDFGTDRDIEVISSFELPVFVLSPPKMSILFSDKIKKGQALAFDTPFVLPSRATALRFEIDRYFIRQHLNPVCIFESNIISSIVRAACEGMGLTILPRVYVTNELKSKKLVSVNSKPLWKHKISLIGPKVAVEEERIRFSKELVDQLNAVIRV